MVKKQYDWLEEQRRQAAEEAWLNYFNRVLYEQNLITERQRNQMVSKIASRKSSAAKQKDRDMEL